MIITDEEIMRVMNLIAKAYIQVMGKENLMQLQRKIDAEDQFVVPYAEMTYKMKFISKEELDAIRERFEGEVK